MTLADTQIVQKRGVIARNTIRIQNLVIGTLLALSPPTSLVLLGWLMRQTRAAAFARIGLSAWSPN